MEVVGAEVVLQMGISILSFQGSAAISGIRKKIPEILDAHCVFKICFSEPISTSKTTLYMEALRIDQVACDTVKLLEQYDYRSIQLLNKKFP